MTHRASQQPQTGGAMCCILKAKKNCGRKPKLKEVSARDYVLKKWHYDGHRNKLQIAASLTMDHLPFLFRPFIVPSIREFYPVSLRKICVSNVNTRSAEVKKSPILPRFVSTLPVQKITLALSIGKQYCSKCVKQVVLEHMLNGSQAF